MSKLPLPGSRAVEEWVGRSPDTPVPPRVQLRVFERAGGRCYLTGRKISPGEAWEVEHIQAIVNGGENRESNLAPALVAPHREKTREDIRQKAASARRRKSHIGIKRRKALIPGSKGTGWKKPLHGPAYRRDE